MADDSGVPDLSELAARASDKLSALVDSIEQIVRLVDVHALATSLSQMWFYARSIEMVGFTEGQLLAYADGRVSSERIRAFLDLTSVEPNDIQGDPDPLALPPLAKSPLIKTRDRYFLFVPGVLFESLLHGFHGRLFDDAQYRATYDNGRAQWLEESSLAAFRRLIPNAQLSGWGLEYGPRRARLELDGLLLYDNKVVLLECKWKSPRLLALRGDVDAILADVDKAVVAPLRQAKRARDYLHASGDVEFVEKSTGRRFIVQSTRVKEVFLVTMVGSGVWARIAANLRTFTPLGLFADGVFPWALSVGDLRVVSECLELSSQLFDYLRRRDRLQADGRFQLHDEWDYLGTYLSGALDPDDPRFPVDVDGITLDAFDNDLQEYHHSLAEPEAPRVAKPRRAIPENVLELLLAAEKVPIDGRSDAICTVLGWSDDGLVELSKMLKEVRRKTIWDGRAHAVVARHPWKKTAIVLSCGHRAPEAIADTMLRAIDSKRSEWGNCEWAGFGVDISGLNPLQIVHEG